jgi:two-component system, OmpR family, alkaline phosphatase synthesis response regulator PhoP
MLTILVADDDPEIVDLLKMDFELMGFTVDVANDGQAAAKKAETNTYDLIVMDVMMPRMDGFEACKRIRSGKHGTEVPIILLTAKGQLEDKVRGFNAGADDYLIKPFEFQELMVRMRALLRRTGRVNAQGKLQPKEAPNNKQERLAAGALRLLPTSLEMVLNGQLQKLTPTEFEILYCLMQHVNEPVPLATLLKEVWGYEADEDVRMLRVHIGGLRQKLEPDPKQPTYLQTVTHIGYRLVCVESPSP